MEQNERSTNERSDRQLNGLTERMDGRIDGQIDGRIADG